MESGRRRLTAIDDPLAGGIPFPAPRPERASAAEGRAPAAAALYVRLRPEEADRLARAAFELRVHKREIISALIAAHVDGTTEDGRNELQAALQSYRDLLR